MATTATRGGDRRLGTVGAAFPVFEVPERHQMRLALAEAQRAYEHAKRAHYHASQQVIEQQRACDKVALELYRAARAECVAETPAKEAHKRDEKWLAECDLLQQFQDDRHRLDLDVSIARERLRTVRALFTSGDADTDD